MNQSALLESSEEISESILMSANINPKTYLATDYLNHFNEALMLIEILPMDNSILDDLNQWQPSTYKEHFANSHFKGKDIAIKAYDLAEPAIRLHFENAVLALDNTLLSVLETIKNSPSEQLERDIEQALPLLREEISALMAIISGDQSHNVATFEQEAQAAIDELFD